MAQPPRTPANSYMPGLTGLRGVAVVAVLAYHLELIDGGFIGVDMFFALSGFLITTLLLAHEPRTPADLFTWWKRRFRRLVPAVGVVVIVSLIVFRTRSGITLDSIATLTWWQNWHLIAEGRAYWAPNPSVLRHAWSLSIEEQFYLFWPLTMITLLGLGRRLRIRRPKVVMAAGAGVIAVASFAWAAVLTMGDDSSLSRVYYGTDTRVGGLLAGCAVAGVLSHLRARPVWRPRRYRRLRFLVPVSIGVLAVQMVWMSPERAITYRGGLVLTTAASMVLVVASTSPGRLTGVLGRQPFQWLGEHSYAIYLWSWPTQIFYEERLTTAPRAVIVAATTVTALAFSAVSLPLIEEPLRRHRDWAGRVATRRVAWTGGYALVVVLLLAAHASTVPSVTEQLREEFERVPDPVTTTTEAPCIPVDVPETTVPDWDDDGADTTVPIFDERTVEKDADPVWDGCTVTHSVLVVGDSTARGAANGLRRLGREDLTIWDRSETGCGLSPAPDKCPDWRQTWRAAIDEIDPDVVLAYLWVYPDLVPGFGAPFLSEEASELRRTVFTEATDILSSRGAKVIWTLPPDTTETGSFYCQGKKVDSACDPQWVTAWNEDLVTATAGRASTIDVRAWVAARPPEGADVDRPDGLHFSGRTLDEHAAWLADQITAVLDRA